MAGSVQYFVADVISLPPLDTSPNGDMTVICWKGWNNLDHLFDPTFLIIRSYQIWKERGQVFCEQIFTAWTSAVRSLSHEEVNAFERPGGKTVLNRCLALLQALDNAEDMIRQEDPEPFRNFGIEEFLDRFYDKRFPGDWWQEFLLRTCASMTIELIRQKLTRQTVETSFPHRSEAVKADLWSLVRGRKSDDVRLRGRDECDGAFHYYGDGLGAHLLMALIDKGLPRWCWAGHLGPFNDSLLQYVLEPAPGLEPKHDREGELCIFLAERFSLEELCHQNEDGRIALSYAHALEDALWRRFRPQAWWWPLRPPPRDGGVWMEVLHVIKEQMGEKVRHFEGSLLELMELARRARAGWGGDLALFRGGFLQGEPAGMQEKQQHSSSCVKKVMWQVLRYCFG